jgi:hypothetical protein
MSDRPEYHCRYPPTPWTAAGVQSGEATGAGGAPLHHCEVCGEYPGEPKKTRFSLGYPARTTPALWGEGPRFDSRTFTPLVL